MVAKISGIRFNGISLGLASAPPPPPPPGNIVFSQDFSNGLSDFTAQVDGTDDPAGLALYNVVSGSPVSTNAMSALSNSNPDGDVYSITQTLGASVTADEILVQFKLPTITTGQAAAIQFQDSSNNTVFSFVPQQSTDNDPDQTPFVFTESTFVGLTLTSPYIADTWYEMSFVMGNGASTSTVTITQISNSAVIATATIAPALLQLSIDKFVIFTDEGDSIPSNQTVFGNVYVEQNLVTPSGVEGWAYSLSTTSPYPKTTVNAPFASGLLNPTPSYGFDTDGHTFYGLELVTRSPVSPYTASSNTPYSGAYVLPTTWTPGGTGSNFSKPTVVWTPGLAKVTLPSITINTWSGGILTFEPLSYPGVRTVVNYDNNASGLVGYPQISYEYVWATGP